MFTWLRWKLWVSVAQTVFLPNAAPTLEHKQLKTHTHTQTHNYTHTLVGDVCFFLLLAAAVSCFFTHSLSHTH